MIICPWLKKMNRVKYNFMSFPIQRLVGLGGLGLFIFFPYWQLLSNRPLIQAAVLIILLLLIFCWDKLNQYNAPASDSMAFDTPQLTGFDYLYCLLIPLLLFIDQLKFLTAPISWKGDEDAHIIYALRLPFLVRQSVGKNLIPILLAASIIVGYYLLKERFARKAYAWLMPIGAIIAIFVMAGPPPGYRLTRYPPLIVIIEALFANPILSTKYSELAHRLTVFIPYLTVFLISFFIAHFLKLSRPLVYLLPVIIVTAPLAYYHAAIVYIEPLLVAVQFYVLFKIFTLQKATPYSLFEIASLASITGVMKENALPFLVAAFLFMLAKIVFSQDFSRGNKLRLILKLSYITFLPICIYLVFRKSCGDIRPYTAQFSHLFNLTTYYTYALAMRQQIGWPAFIISAIGLAYLGVSKQRRGVFWFSITNFLLYFITVTAENYLYIGYSRFMLHLLPTFYAGLVGFFLWVKNTKNLFPSVLASVLIGYNLFISPRSFAERSNWGIYNCEICSEYYLPYPEAISYIASHYPSNYSFIIGGMKEMDYPYRINFYMHKFGVKQKFLGQFFYGGHNGIPLPAKSDKFSNPELSIASARRLKADLLLFHNLNSSEIVYNKSIRFIKRFSLGNHCLDLYETVNHPDKNFGSDRVNASKS